MSASELIPGMLPWPLLPADGGRLDIGPDGIFFIVQFTRPTEAEVADLRRGPLEIGVVTVGGTGVLVLRFGAAPDTPRPRGTGPLVFDAPWHIGILPPERRRLPERPAGLSLALTVVIHDELGRQHGARHLALAIPTAEAIEKIVARQAEEAARPSWTKAVHDAELAAWVRRYPDVERAAATLLRRAWATETLQ